MRVLVAEDDPKLLKTLLHIFRSNQFAADGVSNGNDALAYALSGEYDGLVLDIMMPGLDGVEVLRRLRREPERHSGGSPEPDHRKKQLWQLHPARWDPPEPGGQHLRLFVRSPAGGTGPDDPVHQSGGGGQAL